MAAAGWQRRQEHTRHRVLTAAGEIIGESGLDGLTMRKLAARAGVAVATLYNQFGDRNGVLVEFVRNGLDQLERALDHQPAHAPLDATWALFATLDGVVDAQPQVWRSILSMLRRNRGPHGLGPLGDRLVLLIVHDLGKAAADGMFVIDCDVERLARHVFVTRMHRLEKWALGVIDWDAYQDSSALGLNLMLAAVLADPAARAAALRESGVARD
ncbi:MAG: TetR/AcrR family transcriptional regulator [Ilumatobacter sp.]|nr:TetR/AcrR family transcriptional regulator [Ilumatobacter sp.]